MSTYPNIGIYLLLICLPLLVGSLTLSAQGGVVCSDAQEIHAGTQFTAGLTGGFGAQRPEAIHARWFRFVAPQDGLLSLESCHQQVDTRVFLYRGDCSGLQLVATNDDACDMDQSSATQNDYAAAISGLFLEKGDTLLIQWDDHWSSNPFTWTLTFLEQPADASLSAKNTWNQVVANAFPAGYPLDIWVTNRGHEPLRDLILHSTVYDLRGQLLWNTQQALDPLGPGMERKLTGGMLSLEAGQEYQVVQYLESASDQYPDNDTLRQIIRATPDTWAHQSNTSGHWAGPTGTIGRFAQSFLFDQEETIQAISIPIDEGQPGDAIFLQLYAMVDGHPDRLLRTAGPFFIPPTSGDWQTFRLPASGWTIPAREEILVAVRHQGTEKPLRIGYSYCPERHRSHAWTQNSFGQWLRLASEGLDIHFNIWLHPERPQQTRYIRLTTPDSLSERPPDLIYRINQDTPQVAKMFSAGGLNWIIPLDLPVGDTLHYRFRAWNGLEETVPEGCRMVPGKKNWRSTPIELFGDPVLPNVCFSRCLDCTAKDQCSTADFLLCDHFDNYDQGSLVNTNASWWTPLHPESDARVTADQSSSAPQSLLIDEGGRKQTNLTLGLPDEDQISELTFQMWVPKARSAGFSLVVPEHPSFNFGLLLGTDANGQPGLSGQGYSLPNRLSVSYPSEQWIDIRILIDPGRKRIRLLLNQQIIDETDLPRRPEQLQLFSPNRQTQFYVDDVQLRLMSQCRKDALLCESFEWYYPATSPSSQSAQWGFQTDEAIVQNDRSALGQQALYLNAMDHTTGTIQLGGWQRGRFQLEWQQYIPSGKSAGLALSDSEGQSWFQVLHNRNGQREGEGIVGAFEHIYQYPQDTWLAYRMIIDLNAKRLSLFLNGERLVSDLRFRQKQLDHLVFFSPNEQGQTWIDNIVLDRLPDLRVPISFGVDLSILPEDMPRQAFISGSFTNWEPQPMTRIDEHLFRFQAALPAGDTLAFRYAYAMGDPENGEGLLECGIADTLGQINRLLIVGTQNMDLGYPCYGYCSPCSDVQATSLTDHPSTLPIKISPNPTSGMANLILPTTHAFRELVVYDIHGRIWKNHPIDPAQGQVRLSTAGWPTGTYFLVVRGSQYVQTGKLVKW